MYLLFIYGTTNTTTNGGMCDCKGQFSTYADAEAYMNSYEFPFADVEFVSRADIYDCGDGIIVHYCQYFADGPQSNWVEISQKVVEHHASQITPF